MSLCGNAWLQSGDPFACRATGCECGSGGLPDPAQDAAGAEEGSAGGRQGGDGQGAGASAGCGAVEVAGAIRQALTLPWPPKELSPNARTHWAKRSKAAKSYRKSCWVHALAHGIKVVGDGRVMLALEFFPPDRRSRDDDNLLASFKAGRDGLADALGIDDSRFLTTVAVSEKVVKGGMVRVEIREIV